jgi:hypothetical protein
MTSFQTSSYTSVAMLARIYPGCPTAEWLLHVTCLTSEEVRGNFFGLVDLMHTT